MKLKACHCCGLVHQIAITQPDQIAYCSRCDSVVESGRSDGRLSAQRCFAATLGGLMLYFPAILLPILEIEKLGHHHSASILGVTWELLLHGNVLVGTIVLLFSLVLPLAKLLALLELSWLGITHRRHQAFTYHLVEWTGRWSMMDVLLLALLVAIIKLGDLVSFHFGPAVIAFAGCVIMSLIASVMFDPHAMWDEVEESGNVESTVGS